jgi:hypothetical protein
MSAVRRPSLLWARMYAPLSSSGSATIRYTVARRPGTDSFAAASASEGSFFTALKTEAASAITGSVAYRQIM